MNDLVAVILISGILSILQDFSGKDIYKNALMDFNATLPKLWQKSWNTTDFVFVSMANLTLARRDSNFTHVKTVIPRTAFI